MTNIFEKGLFMLTTLLLQSFALSCSATKGGSTMGLLNIDIQGFHEKFQLSGMQTRTVTLSVSKSRVADISSISGIVWSELKIKSSMIGKLELFLLKQGSTIVEINFDDMVDEDGEDSFFNFSNLVLPARKFKIKSSNKQAKFDPSFLIETNADVITSQTSLGDKNHKSCKILPKFSSALHFLQESYKFVQESQILQICYNVEHFLQDSDNIFAKNAFFW